MIERKRWTWKNVKLARRREEELGRAFQVDIYRAYLETEPEDVDVLMELGNLYTLTGQVARGLEIDRRLVEIRPDEPVFHYNLACTQSLLNDVSAALESLHRAIDLGYSNLEYLQEDSDLENVRHDVRFRHLVDRLRERTRQSKEKLG